MAAQLFLEKGLLEEAELASRRALELDQENPIAGELLAAILEAKGAAEGAALAPEEPAVPEAEAEGDVIGIEALAPEESGVVEIEALAPEEAVVDMATLAPEAEAEGAVIEIEALAPEEPAVVEMEALAPDESAFDVGVLAPADGPFASDLPTDELADEFPLVTRTMAELYARQGLTDRALEVYRQLLERSPGDAELGRRMDALGGAGSTVEEEAPAPAEPAAGLGGPVADEERLDHAWASAALEERHDVDTPFAWTARDDSEEAPPSSPPISRYFDRMLGWEPGREGGADGATSFRSDD